ncbi:MAG: AlpA family phage regulatory protein [Rhizobiales bacterium]|nr:AlpA family phage regulatory protein [Hyphomicrobiales bacterium]
MPRAACGQLPGRTWVKDGRFPKPVKLGVKTTAWRVEGVLLELIFTSERRPVAREDLRCRPRPVPSPFYAKAASARCWCATQGKTTNSYVIEVII